MQRSKNNFIFFNLYILRFNTTLVGILVIVAAADGTIAINKQLISKTKRKKNSI